ncbi:MAG: beta-phosphoglucomutase family hydrolase [Chloroflexota bacterium]
MTTTSIQGLIFDLDGVITHASAEFHFRSWKRLANEENIAFDRVSYEQLRGIARQESLRRFLNGRTLTPDQAADWLERKNLYFLELTGTMTPQDRLPGLTALLDDARAAGLALGVASASRNVHLVLEKLDLLPYFSVVGDPTCVRHPKPAPDIFLWVAGHLQVPVTQCVVFEDSQEGIEAANGSGFWTVAVGGPHLTGAHLHVPDLSDLRLDTLRARLYENALS